MNSNVNRLQFELAELVCAKDIFSGDHYQGYLTQIIYHFNAKMLVIKCLNV